MDHSWFSKYAQISTGDDEDEDKAADGSTSDGAPWIIAVTLLNILVFTISVIIFTLSGHLSKSLADQQGEGGSQLNARWKDISAYSPVLEVFDIKIQETTFNGKLRDNSSIFRQAPSAEVDAAWDYISAEGVELITVSSADISRSQKDPAMSVKAPSSWGAGPDAYLAQIDVFHQIHCLNELRKQINRGYYYPEPPNDLERAHTTHCIHMILQSLMCASDVGIIQHNWVHNPNIRDPKTRPFPDFDMVKKCRDFDSILEWARYHSVPNNRQKLAALRVPSSARIVPGDGYA